MMFSQLGVTFSKFPRYNSTWENGDNDDVLLNYLNNADGNDSLKSEQSKWSLRILSGSF